MDSSIDFVKKKTKNGQTRSGVAECRRRRELSFWLDSDGECQTIEAKISPNLLHQKHKKLSLIGHFKTIKAL